jgi:hypothetical protein
MLAQRRAADQSPLFTPPLAGYHRQPSPGRRGDRKRVGSTMASELPARLPWTGRAVPHGTIEVNHACNMSCDACYKRRSDEHKPLEQIQREIDQLLALRDVCSLTLAGGEPTLHPQLREIIAYVSGKGVRPLLLSNGSLLTDATMAAYGQAGLKRIFLHIDRRQHGRPDIDMRSASAADLDALRAHYVALGQRHQVEVSLAITLYRDELHQLSALLDFCQRTPGVNSVLVTDFSPLLNSVDNPGLAVQAVDNADVHAFMADQVGMRPAWYVPSTHDDARLCWLLYISAYTRDAQGRCEQFRFDPRHGAGIRALPRLARLRYRRYPFDQTLSTLDLCLFIALYALGAGSLRVLRSSLTFALRAARNRDLHVLRLAFQQGPRRLADGSYETCRDCPDATIRNGKLVNLCLVDQVEQAVPLPAQLTP